MLKVKKKIIIIVSSVCFFVLILSFSVSFLREPSLGILEPPLQLFTLIQREFQGLIFYHRNLILNEKLKREVDYLHNKLSQQQEVVLENSRLKDLLSFKGDSTYKLIAAKVIARSADSWTSNIIIDKGRISGIKRSMVVVNFLGLVGKIIEAQESTAKVLLISDPSLSVSAIVQRSRQEGLVCGTLGSHLIMKYLPEEADIQIGDAVITSGFNDVYPKGVIIGTVISIGNEFSGLSRFAIIKPAVNLSNIEEVLIIVL